MFIKKMSARELVYLFAGIERYPLGFFLWMCTRQIATLLVAAAFEWLG
jgi:hypothetical protein